MYSLTLEVARVMAIGQEVRRVAFRAPEIAAMAMPGQFVMVKPKGAAGLLLRRPLSILRLLDKGENLGPGFEILFEKRGLGTEAMLTLSAGEDVEVIGPLGSPFRIPPESDRNPIVLAGGGLGIPPLLFVAQVYGDRNLKVLLGGRSREQLYCLEDFLKLGVQVATATEDGSHGTRGLITQILQDCLASPPSVVLTCGPWSMMKAIYSLSSKIKVPVQASLEARMGCGLGACLGCVVPIKNNGETEYLRSCTEGPVFEGDSILW